MPSSQSGAPLPLRLYRGLTASLLPFALRSERRKMAAAGVAVERFGEKDGRASQPRPAGPLLWFHAASVGESLSVLTLMARLAERLPGHQFLITSGTPSSAAMIARRMPPRCRHQFAPLDAPGPVRRFLDHWRPDAGVFVESELWPLQLTGAEARGIPLALLNARLSKKSVAGWAKVPATAARVLSCFRVLIAQNDTTARNLVRLGADPARVTVGGNLKATSAPLPVDDHVRDALLASLEGRPVWVASSTHPGEEEIVLAAHRALLQEFPDLCLLLVPRHPERAEEVIGLIDRAGLSMARRSTGDWPGKAQVYLADTLGETGTWYAAAPIVFLGGSLLPIGGHNPFEPAQAGCAILSGPHVDNFAETFAPLYETGAAIAIKDAESLSRHVATLLRDPAFLSETRNAARRFAADGRAALESIADRLVTALDLDP